MEFAKKPGQYAPLVLAYIGDGVYEVYVRSRLLAEAPDLPAHKLHKLATARVKAHAQSNSVQFLEPLFTEEELAAYKRGRNAKSATVPKHAELMDYRRATGLEAVIGYLYLKGDEKRLEQIMEQAYDHALDEQD